MIKIVPLLERDFIFCFKSVRFYVILIVCFSVDIAAILRIDPAYVEYVILLATLWILITIFLDLLIYRDIIKNRIPHLLAFGFNIFEVMLSKIIFITLFSLYITFLFVFFLRIMSSFLNHSYTFIGIWNFLILIPVLFFIISISVYLLFRFQISRPLRLVLGAVMVLLNEFRDIITKYSRSFLAVLGLAAFFIISNILIIKLLGGLKNEDII
jgi:hypothetical protein